MTIETDSKISPMMVQWHACKKSAPDGILLFRLGDFYEAFYQDAITIAKELDLTLTKRQEIPMAGVPFHSAEGYIDKLVEKGYRVAIAEQMEDPRDVKGIVKREVVRVVTPGTVITSSLLVEKSSNFLVSIAQVGEIQGLSVLDLTTADFKAMEVESTRALADEIYRLSPKEILVAKKWASKHAELIEEFKTQLGASVALQDDWHFDHTHACDVLLGHFKVHSLDGFGLKGMPAAINAAGAILHYVKEELKTNTDHLTSIAKEHLSRYMQLDRSTQRNLELFESLRGGKRSPTLLTLLDQTQTPMGGRLLKKWLAHPLLDAAEIHERQEGIATFLKHPHQQQISFHLGEIRDLERLMMRIETGYASPRDLAALRSSLEQAIALLKYGIESVSIEDLPKMESLVAQLQKALVDAPPLRLSEGDLFKTGFNPELDTLKKIQGDGHIWVAAYQTQLKETTQIKTLKVGFTGAFGYYIEVSKGQAGRIPESFQRRQTLVNAERFITPELKEFEHQKLHAEEKISALELELFNALRKEAALSAAEVKRVAENIAKIDTLLSLALVASKQGYVRPVVDDGETFRITQGRHPVIASILAREDYIPNDVFFDATDQRLYLITGPNMAGKSTFIRQVALIAILAQMGSFVPAQEAHIGIVDKVFSRIGASDDLSQGQSTFMVEMTETANILHHATDKSLVILDEIGRGTSTYDGIAIAWAVAEHLRKEPGKQAKTLFATHYSELTDLEKEIPGVVNYHIAVHESERGIVFLRKIVRGSTDKSYGIHVAKLAGLPYAAIKRAQARLAKLEKSTGKVASKEKQLSLFAPKEERPEIEMLSDELKKTDPNQLTPLQALQKIIEWKQRCLM
jgi:DNA mismatch repair protein MutS